MSRPPSNDGSRDSDARIVWLLELRVWLFLGMGLTGILTIALIVTADLSYAGIDGMRAVAAFAPATEQDRPSMPVLTGVLDRVRDLPIFSAPAPVSGPTAADAAPAAQPTPAPTAPSELAPSRSTAGPTAPPSAAPAPSPTPSPSPTPAASPTPVRIVAPAPSPTPPPSPTPASGVALTTDRGASAIVALSDLVPGDSLDRTISLTNTGTLVFKYTVSATQSASTLLWSDTTQGLQLTVATAGGTVLYGGPLSGLGSLAGPTTLAPGASETLRYTFAFPAVAPDAFQGLVQDLTLVFSATQYP